MEYTHEMIIDLADTIRVDEYKMVEAHNYICRTECCPEDVIYQMEEFDEIVKCESSMELANMILFGRFNPTHKYFSFNGYGNLVSTDYPEADGFTYPEEMAHYILANEDDCGIYDIDFEELKGGEE